MWRKVMDLFKRKPMPRVSSVQIYRYDGFTVAVTDSCMAEISKLLERENERIKTVMKQG